jgi:hypothetical protein
VARNQPKLRRLAVKRLMRKKRNNPGIIFQPVEIRGYQKKQRRTIPSPGWMPLFFISTHSNQAKMNNFADAGVTRQKSAVR